VARNAVTIAGIKKPDQTTFFLLTRALMGDPGALQAAMVWWVKALPSDRLPGAYETDLL